jgi:hypothetical protein
MNNEICGKSFPVTFRIHFIIGYSLLKPIPVAARSKAWVCGRSLAGIAGSNPAGDMTVCCECCVLSGRGLFVGLVQRSPTGCERMSVIVKPR